MVLAMLNARDGEVRASRGAWFRSLGAVAEASHLISSKQPPASSEPVLFPPAHVLLYLISALSTFSAAQSGRHASQKS